MSRRRPSAGAVVLTVILAVLAVGAGSGGVAAQEIDQCRTIDSPGTYELNTSVTTGTSAACFVVTSSDVVLDGQHNTVTLTGSGDAVNVTSPGFITNVTVRNLQVSGGSTGFVVHAPGAEAGVGVTVRDNVVTGASKGLTATADGSSSNVDLAVVNNTLTTGEDAIGNVKTDGESSSVEISISNNTLDSDGRGIDNVDANSAGQSVTISVVENDINATNDGIYGIELYGDDSSHTVSIVGNSIESGAGNEGIQFIEAGGGTNQTLAFNVSDNRITAGDHGIGNVNVGGTGTTASVTVLANVVTADADGIAGLTVGSDTQTADIEASGNAITAAADGIRVSPAAATASTSGALVAERNDLHAGESAVVVKDGPVAGIELHNNTLAGGEYGVENRNTTNGTYVDATYNDWNASDGPDSAGQYEDPVTGAVANGSGSNVTSSNETLSNVHFDPYVGAEAAPDFGVTIDSTNSPVTEGESLTVAATVENTGDSAGTQTVTLSAGGVQRDAATATLEGGETTAVALSWETAPGDAGTYTATVATENATDSTSVTVERREGSASPPPEDFEVSLDATNAPVSEGERLTVTATVENAGGQDGTQLVSLSTDGVNRDSTSVTLREDASTTATLSWNTTMGDAGNYTATVDSADDSDSTVVTVARRPPSVTFDNQSVSGEVQTQAVAVESAYLPDGGFVVIYAADGGGGSGTYSVVGASSYRSAGQHSLISVALDRRLNASRTVLAGVHRDTDGDSVFEFGSSEGLDVSYTNESEPVRDSARVDVVVDTPVPTGTPTATPSPTPPPTPTLTATSTPTATPTPTPRASPETPTVTTTATQPGFGPTVAVLALVLGLGLLSRHRD